MFSIHMERSRSDSSASSTSSTLSLSPYGWTPRGPTLSPPTTTTASLGGSLDYQRIAKPTRYRPQHGPKRTHTAPYSLQYETFCPSSGRSSYAYPHWPSGDSLSASPLTEGHRHAGGAAAASSGMALAPPSSKISDEDLEELDFSHAPQPPSDLDTLAAMPVGRPSLHVGISWSQVGAHAAAAPAAPEPEPRRRRRLPPPPAEFRMRTESRGKRSPSRPRNDSAIC